jgi:hypothetical protein
MRAQSVAMITFSLVREGLLVAEHVCAVPTVGNAFRLADAIEAVRPAMARVHEPLYSSQLGIYAAYIHNDAGELLYVGRALSRNAAAGLRSLTNCTRRGALLPGYEWAHVPAGVILPGRDFKSHELVTSAVEEALAPYVAWGCAREKAQEESSRRVHQAGFEALRFADPSSLAGQGHLGLPENTRGRLFEAEVRAFRRIRNHFLCVSGSGDETVALRSNGDCWSSPQQLGGWQFDDRWAWSTQTALPYAGTLLGLARRTGRLPFAHLVVAGEGWFSAAGHELAPPEAERLWFAECCSLLEEYRNRPLEAILLDPFPLRG